MACNAFSCRVAQFFQCRANTRLTSPSAEWGLFFFFFFNPLKERSVVMGSC